MLPTYEVGPIRADWCSRQLPTCHSWPAARGWVVGLDLLTHSSFSIDYEHRRLTFGSVVDERPSVHSGCHASVPHRARQVGGHLFACS